MTRLIQDTQLKLCQTAIEQIKFDQRSRDDIPQILQGLQYMYTNIEIRTALFQELKRLIPDTISISKGRCGLELWKIFVMGTLRINLNWDYDRLHEMVNTHQTIRAMLGHASWGDETKYTLQRLKDNVKLFTPDLLDTINKIVVKAGHGLLKKRDAALTLYSRCDSFVVETDVHYPTDINLLYDAMRKVIQFSSRLCEQLGDTNWRQHQYLLRQCKQAFRRCQKTKRVQYKNTKRRAANEEKVKAVYSEYTKFAQKLLIKSEKTLEQVRSNKTMRQVDGVMLEEFIQHAHRQIDQIRRRVLQREVISHKEKVFSLFEPHTEWISKGKAKAPVELGKRVCIMEDQFGFILHHQVMEKVVDSSVAVDIVKETKERFKDLACCSFDKGFYTPGNRVQLNDLLNEIILPKKGRLNEAEKERISEPVYKKRRHQHAAVESAINALEVHGLDRCLDHGLLGFKRYVGWAVVARNIQQIGVMQDDQKKKKVLRRKTY